jgi:triosephosphate isomerase (TIM)
MSRPIFAANWKMNHGPSDAREFLRSFLQYYPRHSDRQIILFPSTVALAAVVEGLKDRSDIRVGIQNIYWEAKGAFTGEVSASMARDAGAHYALVGHSERRHVFGETDEQTGRKVAACFRAGLTPILCIGEKLEERESGETDMVVLRQLRAGLSGIEPAQIAHVLIAYEPVWAIGTGKNATPEDASRVHRLIRYELKLMSPEKYTAIPILYGGSVNRGNVAPLLAAADVEGVLVGGASLDPEAWSSIVRA